MGRISCVNMEDSQLQEIVADKFNKTPAMGLHTVTEIFPTGDAPAHTPDQFWVWMSGSGWRVSQAQVYPPDKNLFDAVACSDLAGARDQLRLRTVDPNSVKLNGTAAIHVATRECPTVGNKAIAVLRALLANGANANVFNADKQTPLMIVSREVCTAGVEMLLANGADPNLTDPAGNTALH